MDVLQYFVDEWPAISSAPVSFITGAFVVGLAMYGLARLQTRDRVSSLEERLKLKDDRIADYENQLGGASPDEAKERMDDLQAQIQQLRQDTQPRSLTDEQREQLAHSLGPTVGSIIIFTDLRCDPKDLLGPQLAHAFESAGWRVDTGQVMGPGNPPVEGLSIRSSDRLNPSQLEQSVIAAFSDTAISFSLQGNKTRNEFDVELLVTIAAS